MNQNHHEVPSTDRHGPREVETVRTTIVGGRPLTGGRNVRNVPRGIEVLVKKASVDAEFRNLFLTQRSGAAQTIGLCLDKTEAAIINSIPEKSLASITDGITPDKPPVLEITYERVKPEE